MLDFWYSERCTRQIKLIVSILSCAIIYYCSTIEKLSVTFTLICLALGFSIHFLRIFRLKILQKQSSQPILNRVISVLPLIALCLIIGILPQNHRLFLAIQCVGFSALGFFIVSIYSNRAQRFE